MNTLDRRRFLRLGGLAAASAAFPPSIQRALAIPAASDTGTIMDVQHVVILMQENRAFDHYFGMLPGVRGFGDRHTIPLTDGRSVWQQRRGGPEGILPYHLDSSVGNAQRVEGTPHSWPDAQAAWNHGRTGYWPLIKQPQSMGYYQQAELQFQTALADAFTLCDAYHCSFHGGTNPNRLFLFTGTNDPSGAGGGPALDNSKDDLGPPEDGYTWTTYAERLEAAGISWKLYQDMADNYTDNPLEGFAQYRDAYYNDPSSPLMKALTTTLTNSQLTGLRDDVLAGLLPQVSWIVGPAAYSEHPGPSSPVQGGWYVQEVLNALTADPAVWSRTVLLVMFDENDGFFDHVPPPCAPSRRLDGSVAGASTVDDQSEQHAPTLGVYGPGPRVPLIAISPWSRGGWVNSQVFDHTSVLRFLEARFGVMEPNISPWRRAVCGDLTSAFDFATPNDDPLPALPQLSQEEADAIRAAQEALPPVPVPRGALGELPQQPAGLRPSRALPYALAVDAEVHGDAQSLQLTFINHGSVGAVFQVYDLHHLEELPRRYTVEAAKALRDYWNASASSYDLWLLGPAGFHRRYSGQFRTAAAGTEISARHEAERGGLRLVLRNTGLQATTVVLRSEVYAPQREWRYRLAPRSTRRLRLPLSSSAHWYELLASCVEDPSWQRRLAGRVETGHASLSDPAIGRG